ncbi:unnamed protein product [Penicillium salamii]|uniref:CENP-V/GFA domain-containing protein n=1 Tax=Penicillium salamii TaxID=1612424 RepID=A0A9W4IZZ0_9EURO|nr:unnamed protein product [Penicillium salamii]CAG8037032.1 unnamed protein product [Penicillium salamii]CAG8054824.1 unnamed protein product [Penicillium salamii]CAG8203257.1 unnamed protein product [Penicillium salamii]CAG8325620.1 unnamed protein product [Penicillium salamii]
MTSGACACNYISYTTTTTPTRLVNCHCNTCRKQAGAPYQTWAHFSTDDIEWQIKPTERRASSTATRSFCPRCGSTVSMALDRIPGLIGLAAGTLNEGDAPIPRPSHHIFLAEKAAWFEVPEDGAQKWDLWSEW